jgi:CubicO group peptidase (beta-lactamase class C family)
MQLRIFALLLFGFLEVRSQNSLYFPPLTGSTWDTIHPANLGWCQEGIDTLVQFAGNNNTKALLILKDGKMALEQYYGNFNKDSLWYWASAGKTLTAVMTGIAQQEGYLNLSDPSALHLGSGWSAMSPAQESAVTLWHHLTMTTGLDPDVADLDCTLDTCLQYETFPGIDWYYHNAPYTLIQYAIDSAIGTTSYLSYFNTKLRNRLGMNGTWIPQGFNRLYVSNARSAARFGLMILAGGRWNTDTILTDTAFYHDMINTSQSANESYGYLWWLNGKNSFMLPGSKLTFQGELFPAGPDDMVCALGKNDQKIYVIPSQNMVVVRLGNAADGPTAGPSAFDNLLWTRINGLVCTTGQPEWTDETLRLAPNPARTTVQLKGTYDRVKVYDSMGRLCLTGSGNNPTWSVEHLPAGVYAVVAQAGQQISRAKLVIAW